MHAAFPLAITPDLLYRLWATFVTDEFGSRMGVPWVAVPDIILAGFVSEVRHETFQFDKEVQHALVGGLFRDQRFGPRRLEVLSGFILDYYSEALNPHLSGRNQFARLQTDVSRFLAVAFINPTDAGRRLERMATAKPITSDDRNLVRLAAVKAPLIDSVVDLQAVRRAIAEILSETPHDLPAFSARDAELPRMIDVGEATVGLTEPEVTELTSAERQPRAEEKTRRRAADGARRKAKRKARFRAVNETIHRGTTVYFVTNRVVAAAVNEVDGYQAAMVPPLSPNALTFGTALIVGVDVAIGAQGVVSQIADVNQGAFSQRAIGDILNAGRNLLLFIHGFDNTFSDVVTRTAFNREWLAASALPGTDATAIAFSWPSMGQLIAFPIHQHDYLRDQNMARNSGLHLMTFFANLEPILRAARAKGSRVTLLAHGIGNLALQAAVENWFLHGNGNALMFDLAILAAADCAYDTFDQPNLGGLSGLTRLAKRVSIYYSHADQVLQLSMAVNSGVQRLGQNGPRDRSDTTSFPPAQFTMVDCSQYRDYDFNFLTSHQYYRLSPGVRVIVAADKSQSDAGRI